MVLTVWDQDRIATFETQFFHRALSVNDRGHEVT